MCGYLIGNPAVAIRYVLATLLVISGSLSPANHLHWCHHGAGYRTVVKALSVLRLRLYQWRVRHVVGSAVVGPAPSALVTRGRVALVVGALVPLIVRTLTPAALSSVSASATSLITAAALIATTVTTATLVLVAATATSALSDRECVGLSAGILEDITVLHIGAMGLVVVELLISLGIVAS